MSFTQNKPHPFKSANGFTLLELVMVMVVVGILTAMTTDLLIFPVKSYLDLERRTYLVDSADLAIRRLQRDVRRALPNSIRVTGAGTVLEMLHIMDGGRYRSRMDNTLLPVAGLCTGNPIDDILSFSLADDCFEVLGPLTGFDSTATAGESLVIYNLGLDSVTANAYAGNNRTQVVNSGDSRLIKFNPKSFPLSSPLQRFFIVDTPITYKCDLTTGHLLRYSEYAITAAQPNPPAGAVGEKQADHVSSCSFSYSSGVASRSGLVTVEIALTDAAGESVKLLHQIHVDNAP